MQTFVWTLDAFNAFVPYTEDLEPVSCFSKIQRYKGRASEGTSVLPGATEMIMCSQHCELTLSLYLTKLFRRRNRTGTIKIGGSKSSCYWCWLYLLELNQELKRSEIGVVIQRMNGKSVKGWLPPKHLSKRYQKLNDTILQSIGEKVECAFWEVKALWRKGAGSQSLSDVPDWSEWGKDHLLSTAIGI